MHLEKCFHCNGTGEIERNECSECNGSGQVAVGASSKYPKGYPSELITIGARI